MSFGDAPIDTTGNTINDGPPSYTVYEIVDRGTGVAVYQTNDRHAQEDVFERRQEYNDFVAERPGASKAEALSAVLPDYTSCHRLRGKSLSSWEEADIVERWKDMAAVGAIDIDIDDLSQDDWDYLAASVEKALGNNDE